MTDEGKLNAHRALDRLLEKALYVAHENPQNTEHKDTIKAYEDVQLVREAIGG